MYRLVISLLLLIITVAACEPLPSQPHQPPAPSPLLRIGLSDGAGAMADLLTAYDAVPIQFVLANEETLFTDLASGQLDAVLAYAAPSDEMWLSPVAVDGLVVIVHPDSPIDALSRGEVAGLFAGDGADVTLYSRERGAGAQMLFEQRVMAERRLDVNAVVLASDGGMITAVSQDKNGIGYSMMSGLSPAVKAVAIDNITPSPATVAAQTYPLTAPLYAIAPAEPTGALRDFVAWLQSDAGQAVIGGVFGTVR